MAICEGIVGWSTGDLDAGRCGMKKRARLLNIQSDFGRVEHKDANLGETFSQCLETSIAMRSAVCLELLYEDTIVDTVREMI